MEGGSWVVGAGGEEQDSEPVHRSTPVEGEHEGDVLQKEPGRSWIRAVEQPEDLVDQPRSGAAGPGRTAGLTQVLAGKAGSDEIDLDDLARPDAQDRLPVLRADDRRRHQRIMMLLCRHVEGADDAYDR